MRNPQEYYGIVLLVIAVDVIYTKKSKQELLPLSDCSIVLHPLIHEHAHVYTVWTEIPDVFFWTWNVPSKMVDSK